MVTEIGLPSVPLRNLGFDRGTGEPRSGSSTTIGGPWASGYGSGDDSSTQWCNEMLEKMERERGAMNEALQRWLHDMDSVSERCSSLRKLAVAAATRHDPPPPEPAELAPPSTPTGQPPANGPRWFDRRSSDDAPTREAGLADQGRRPQPQLVELPGACPSETEDALTCEGVEATKTGTPVMRMQMTAVLGEKRHRFKPPEKPRQTWARVTSETVRMLGLHEVLSQEEQLRTTRLWRVTHSSSFVALSSGLILLNAVFMGVQANLEVHEALLGRSRPSTLLGIELFFVIWFACELILRITATRISFFIGKEWKMNILDFSLVMVSVSGRIVNPAGVIRKACFARVFRLMRFVHIFRVLRVIRSFHSLRLLAFSVMESLGTLWWCFLLVFVVVYIFAILFLHGSIEYFRDNIETKDSETYLQLQENFGSIMKAMICLFMTISGGIDWLDAMRPLRAIHAAYEPAFVFYAFLMLFGVINVVAATFVENTASIARKDKEALIHTEMKQVAEYITSIRQFFNDADVNASGMLTWDEFAAYLEDDKVKAYFHALDLDVSEAQTLFTLLDADGNGEVEMSEFVNGCLRLKGNARNIDVNILIRRNERLMTRMAEHTEAVQTMLERVERTLESHHKGNALR